MRLKSGTAPPAMRRARITQAPPKASRIVTQRKPMAQRATIAGTVGLRTSMTRCRMSLTGLESVKEPAIPRAGGASPRLLKTAVARVPTWTACAAVGVVGWFAVVVSVCVTADQASAKVLDGVIHHIAATGAIAISIIAATRTQYRAAALDRCIVAMARRVASAMMASIQTACTSDHPQ